MRRINQVPLGWATFMLLVGILLCCNSSVTSLPSVSAADDDPVEAAAAAREAAKQAEIAKRNLERARMLAEQAKRNALLQRRQAAQVAAMLEARPANLSVEQIVFGRDGGLEVATQQLEILQEREIKNLVAVCQLTEAQQSKVELLCRGDIKRFFDRVEMLKASQTGEEMPAEILQQARELTTRFYYGLFREKSLLRRTLPTILDDFQKAKFETALASARESIHKTAVRQVVLQISKRAKMSTKERQQFEAFLFSETKAPAISCGYDQYFILLQLDRITDARLAAQLNESQLGALNQLSENAKLYRDFMKRTGYFSEDEESKD